MALLVTASPTISLDGFMAAPGQDEENPLGVGGRAVHDWIFATRSGRAMIGQSGGSDGIDEAVFQEGLKGGDVTIMGRNMFGPVRGPWGDSDWKGWWGDEPPFHHLVMVLTNFERPDLIVGETTFSFVTDGIASAMEKARAAAPDGEVHVSGGAATLRAFLAAQLIDRIHISVAPIYLGEGESLVATAGQWPEGYECVDVKAGEGATHYLLLRTAPTSL